MSAVLVLHRLHWFISLVWRPCVTGLGRIGWRTAWRVADIITRQEATE